jgi:L-cysteine S-thiosulfotransferase
MRRLGSARSRPKPFPEAIVAAAAALLLWGEVSHAALNDEALQPHRVVGDAIPEPLTGTGGDPVAGRGIVVDRRLGACLLCHTGPFPEERFQGTLAPDLSGAGSRWSPGQLRLRLVDATRLEPATIMPPYYRIDGLTRVGSPWLGRPILTAQQVEDVVAFLTTLRD